MSEDRKSRTVEFWFDFGSPAAYLAWTQLPAIAMECRAGIAWRPMLLGGVFKATGNQSPVLVEAKGKWMWGDLARWARRYGAAFAMNPHFMFNTLTLMRGAVGYQMREPDRFLKYVDVMYRATWVEGRNVGDLAVVAELLKGAGFDPGAFAEMVGSAEVKARLIAVTDEAVRRGVFGAPTMFVGEEMFWGQDRLEFVREALKA
jgi:2-hydroxychromene-2-carboxylate isomerase